MGVIGKQRPGIHGEPGGRHERRQAAHEVGAIALVAEDGAPLNPADHHMVQHARSVQPGVARQGRRTARLIE
jgi:hypothetical protein